jgi:hypothetical protein
MYAQALAPCIGCRQPFWFHPNFVPSITIDGERQPICADCVERINPQRIKNGVPPIVPHERAYAPAHESELEWGDD